MTSLEIWFDWYEKSIFANKETYMDFMKNAKPKDIKKLKKWFDENQLFLQATIQLGNLNGNKIHPTQKPIALYKWILNKYAKAGDTILDTHLGSGSSAIAAHDGGFEFTGIELDEEYYNAAKERIMLHQRQLNLF